MFPPRETPRTGLAALTGRGFCSGFVLVNPPESLSEQDANEINKEKLGFDKVWGVPSRRHVAPGGNPCVFVNRTPFETLIIIHVIRLALLLPRRT